MHKFSYDNESDEIMLVYPNGRVTFIGIWDAICTMWDLVRHRKSFTINGELIERSPVKKS